MENEKKKSTRSAKTFEVELPEPVMASLGEVDRSGGIATIQTARASEGTTSSRRNRAGSVTKLGRFSNLENGVVPYVYGDGAGNYAPDISLRDTIILCQKSYYNVPIFRNTIDLMTEFSLSDIYLTGGNVQSKKFFDLWLKKIDVWSIQDQFYRELYRSGNIFYYIFNADITRDSMMKIQEAFGDTTMVSTSMPLDNKALPIKYILLNPADINVLATSSFSAAVYTKVLNDYEIQSLLNPRTEEDKLMAEKIPEIRALMTQKKKMANLPNQQMKIPLDPARLITSFYKKQGYEPLSVPMGFAVLEDINSKLELKKIDQAIARTTQQAVLLITLGDEKVGLPSQKNIEAMQSLFQSQSVGKVLVADYTTKAEFVLPDIGTLLNPEKYEILDRDIRTGLNNILFGEEKFSNTSVKVKVFFARLRYGREKFLRDFLIPEMKRVGKILGFKSIPEPKLTDVDFEDDTVMSRIYAQLAQLGILTPEETLDVFQTGRLPTPEESLESQKNLADYKEKGYYAPMTMPIAGGPLDVAAYAALHAPAPAGPTGRPSGTGGIKKSAGSKQRVTASVESYSCTKMRDVMVAMTKVEGEIESFLRKKYKIRKLSFEQKDLASTLAETVARKEKMEDWSDKAISYCENIAIASETTDQEEKIDELAVEHGLNSSAAVILYHSKKVE